MTENINRSYYSIRTGKNPLSTHLDLESIRPLFKVIYQSFDQKGYFQEAFGYDCVDMGSVSGNLGTDIGSQLFLILRKKNLWPFLKKCLEYSEDDLFDIIEFLFDNVSKPIDGYNHEYSGCGWHYSSFDKKSGQKEFIDAINRLFKNYQEGYELSDEGEILALAEDGLETLLKADLPVYNPANIEDRIASAIKKFRRHRSSPDDRRDAIRDLADVLEFIRPEASKVISTKDENDLFNLANNFGIRHHNDLQKNDYDKNIWLSWMFYYYLSTIHASIRLIKKSQEKTDK